MYKPLLILAMMAQSLASLAQSESGLLLEAEAQGVLREAPSYVKLYIASMSEAAKIEALKICYALRNAGIGCETDMAGRSFKAQMKYAGKQGIPFLAVIGDDELASGEVKIKNMADGSETPVKLSGIGEFLAGK